MKHGRISVVVPCFNEEKTIYKNLKRISQYLADRFDEYEIIAVNDGSLDDTLGELEKAARDFSVKIVRNSVNRGKGKAVRDGILAGRHDLVMFLDADLAIPIEELEKFIPELRRGSDVVIASRFVPGLIIKTEILWYRRIMERVFRLLRRLIVNGWRIQDTQCGFKVFRREAAADIFPLLTVSRFAFDAEVIFVANKLGYKIKELPVTLQNPVVSHIRFFRDPMNMFLDLIRIRLNEWNGKYKK